MKNPDFGMPEKLYHYTDFNAMRGIITNGEIWLWNLRRMNDSQEMQYFVNELKTAIKKLTAAENHKVMEEVFKENLKDFSSLSSYAACFSEYADDAAQWSRYAKNGMGVCIAFNTKLLSQIGEEGHTPLCRVNYAKSCENLEIAKELASLIQKAAESKKDDEQEQIRQKIRETFNALITSSPLFKHPSFISEKEFRLVSLPYNVEKYLGEPHFFVEETNIKKYYILNMKNVCSSLSIPYTDIFEEICIGPQARVTREVLSDYFSATGVSELCKKISISECPLRRF